MDEFSELEKHANQFEKIEPAKEEVSEADGWRQANRDDLEKFLYNKEEPIMHLVPIDKESKVFIKMWIRELPVTEQLDMLELFMHFGKKGEATLKWKQYYAHAFSRMVVKTEPRFSWKEARFFNKRFLQILMEYLPNPFEDESMGLDQDTQKNS